MKSKEFWNNCENKKVIKRWLLVTIYVVTVFNGAIPARLWSLPVAVGLYFIYTLLPFSHRDTKGYIMSAVMKLCWLILITALTFGISVRITAAVCYGLLAVEGGLYCDRRGQNTSSRIKAERYLSLTLTTIATACCAFGCMIIDKYSIVYISICLAVSIAMLIISGAGVMDEVRFLIRKYFNQGIDTMDEY